jgi:hypothetical protein
MPNGTTRRLECAEPGQLQRHPWKTMSGAWFSSSLDGLGIEPPAGMRWGGDRAGACWILIRASGEGKRRDFPAGENGRLWLALLSCGGPVDQRRILTRHEHASGGLR